MSRRRGTYEVQRRSTQRGAVDDPYEEWKADRLNDLFLEFGTAGEPARFTAGTVRDGWAADAHRTGSRKRQFFEEAIGRQGKVKGDCHYDYPQLPS
jgi:hypothetical protein